jgi:hypothetical protein
MHAVSKAMVHAKRWFRRQAMEVLYASGLLSLWKRAALRNRAVVLMYHRVLSDDARSASASHPGIVVRRQTFERQLRVITRHFRVLTPAEFEAVCAAAGRSPTPRVW